MRITRTYGAVLGLTVMTALGGCGGSAAEEPGDAAAEASAETTPADSAPEETESAEEPPEESPEVVSIDRAAFCDRIDPALVESALGAPSQWMVQRKPGDTYEVFLGEKEKETHFYCRWQTNQESQDYGPDDATFAVRIFGKPATPALADSKLNESKDYLESIGKELGCEETDVTFGDPSFTQACMFKGDRYNDPNTSVTMTGVFGDSLTTCYIQRAGPKEAAQLPGLRDVCAQVPEALGS